MIILLMIIGQRYYVYYFSNFRIVNHNTKVEVNYGYGLQIIVYKLNRHYENYLIIITEKI